MLQLAQYLRDGRMELMEVPLPALKPGYVLVKNHHSAISSGTEGRTVRDARAGLVGKAFARKDDVKKVVETVRKQGLSQAKKLVSDRLGTPLPLGYSCCGEVMEAAADVRGMQAGDMVACAGLHAAHAEVVAVPHLFCAKLPAGVSSNHAAFATLGAIAMQAFRQAGLHIGEHAVVIGLGLVGQIVVQICAAAGVNCTGVDLLKEKGETAVQGGASSAFLADDPTLEEAVLRSTGGLGADAVIICASSDSTMPVNMAGILCREKGRVVLAGNAPSGFDRKNYYRKELSLHMSTSYGPGRYDPLYEEQGVDYPAARVRWTAQRNMQAYLGLLASGKLHPELLLSHRFAFQHAPDAYELLLKNASDVLGILLEYEVSKKQGRESATQQKPRSDKEVRAGCIGAGKFARNYLLPQLRKKVELLHLATSKPLDAKHAAEQFGFARCATDAAEVINDPEVNTVFIATRHNTHAALVSEALRAGKHVFVEKPLCLAEAELDEIAVVLAKSPGMLMVGFNRRFAPFTLKALEVLPQVPRSIDMRINAGTLPPEHWVNDPAVGGGRIVGEVCHFIDLAACLAQSRITSVAARIIPSAKVPDDSVAVLLGFENGSAAQLAYFSGGHSALPKERIEVHAGGCAVLIDDFRQMHIYGRKNRHLKLSARDKGHAGEMEAFIASLAGGAEKGWSCEEMLHSMRATFKVAAAAKSGQAIAIA